MEYFKSNAGESSSDSSDDETQNKKIFNNSYSSRANIYDKYMVKTDKNFIMKNETSNIDVCDTCGVEKHLHFLWQVNM